MAHGTDPQSLRHRVAGRLYALHAATEAERHALDVGAWDLPGEPIPVPEAVAALRDETAAPARPVAVPHAWGPPWGTTWFVLSGTVPSPWRGSPVELHVDLGFNEYSPGFQVEGLVVRPDGDVVQGLHPRQRGVPLLETAGGGEPVRLLVEAAANPTVTSFTAGAPQPDPEGPLYELRRVDLVVPRPDVRTLVHDLEAVDALLALGTATPQVRAALHEALTRLDDGSTDPATVAEAREALAPALSGPAAPEAVRLALVGHAHLDTAWLWPVRETQRKAVRTYANVLRLMDRDDALVFAGSQAAQHAWVRDRHPRLWGDVVARAVAGRWVPVGGMWVEPDTLLPSGESLVRQLVHGQRFFEEAFGRPARTGWLPDCFGYTPALPQLLRLAGIDAFLTQKLSWNDTNRFPHATFWWVGLDGSRVLTHFPPVDTYNAELSADDLVRAVRGAPSGARTPDTLVPFGHGDGGGGPSAAMLARARRLGDLAGAPRAEHVDPDVFFARLSREGLPTWHGELYLETHRGVWTSQRRTKVGDAACDEALRAAEAWCAVVSLLTGAGYPHDALDALWRRHLLLEFHDILPGTSIGRVHREAEAEHASVLAEAVALRDAARAVAGEGHQGRIPDGPAAGRGAAGITDAGRPVLDDGRLRVGFDADGHVVSVLDRRSGRELVPPGERLGLLQLHPDRPTVFDAWNLDRSYLDTVTDLVAATSLHVEPDAVVVTRQVGVSASTARLRWALEEGSRLSLALDVDWHEDDHVLKLAFPLAVAASHHAAGVQLGLVERPNRPATSWDEARYEQWFHGFLHVADDESAAGGAGGVALVSGDLHGYDTGVDRPDAPGTRLRLSLLRAPRFPDPAADRGHHRFEVALLPGASRGEAVEAGREARRRLVEGSGWPPVPDLAGGAQLDAVKLADDRSGDLVLRLHEPLGTAAECVVHLPTAASDVVTTDLLERPLVDGPVCSLAADGRSVALTVEPFQVVTLRVTPRQPAT